MKISRIIINNFRSVEKAQIVASDLNIFVGQNNHGKTNIFEAIDWFFTGLKKGESIEEIRFGRNGESEVSVRIEFTGAQAGVSTMVDPGHKTKMTHALGGSDTVTVVRSSHEPKKRTLIINDSPLPMIPTGFDNTLNEFLPRFEYVDTKKYFEDVGKFAKTTPIGIMLSGVLTALVENSPDYRTFRQQFEKIFGDEASSIKVELDNLSRKVKLFLEKQFPDCTKVTFEVAPPLFDDLLKSFDTTVDDGVETRAAEKGDGMQRALMLAILQAYSSFRRESDSIGRSFLFFVDEAELHLHPSAQRKLKKILLELASGDDQVFINTHSSVLVADDDARQKIYKVEKINKKTGVNEIGPDEKRDVVYELLGGSPSDLLLPKNFLIVEGRSELEFLSTVIRRFYKSKPEIQIIPADGDIRQIDRSLNSVESVFKTLKETIYKEKVVVLIDQTRNHVQLSDFKAGHSHLVSSGRLFELPVKSLEEYYPLSWRKNESDSRSMVGYQKIELAKSVGDSIEKEQFELEMPIVKGAIEKAWTTAFN